jgi:uncharacterized protein (DUF2249 family)
MVNAMKKEQPAVSQTQNPADAIVAHHAEMICELQSRVDQLVAAVGLGKPSVAPAQAILDYLAATIFPHAAAEEAVIYAVAEKSEHRLIASLVLEHGALHKLGGDLHEATTGAERVALAGAIAQLFAVHAAKENEFVIPAVLEQPRTDLAALLHAMHEHITARSHDEVVAELDVRPLQHAQRHDEIFGRLRALNSGEALVVVNDHDPKPLRYQLDALWPSAYAWSYRESGPTVWKVAITRR